VTGVLTKLGELTEEDATTLLRVDAEIQALRRKLAYLQALARGAVEPKICIIKKQDK
jgi:disease resistance protein RPM1